MQCYCAGWLWAVRHRAARAYASLQKALTASAGSRTCSAMTLLLFLTTTRATQSTLCIMKPRSESWWFTPCARRRHHCCAFSWASTACSGRFGFNRSADSPLNLPHHIFAAFRRDCQSSQCFPQKIVHRWCRCAKCPEYAGGSLLVCNVLSRLVFSMLTSFRSIMCPFGRLVALLPALPYAILHCNLIWFTNWSQCD